MGNGPQKVPFSPVHTELIFLHSHKVELLLCCDQHILQGKPSQHQDPFTLPRASENPPQSPSNVCTGAECNSHQLRGLPRKERAAGSEGLAAGSVVGWEMQGPDTAAPKLLLRPLVSLLGTLRNASCILSISHPPSCIPQPSSRIPQPSIPHPTASIPHPLSCPSRYPTPHLWHLGDAQEQEVLKTRRCSGPRAGSVAIQMRSSVHSAGPGAQSRSRRERT